MLRFFVHTLNLERAGGEITINIGSSLFSCVYAIL